ncbi:hypothetical protein PIB30_082311 [Stylosanthes scabra]|uniref:Uncharacterized protein n=1 Tax=Stylosanthes scabra TaxID=79078 RepID=A0ABU6QRK6_9FABA|nr:hypothetical protein [Stylosanthes scabra]
MVRTPNYSCDKSGVRKGTWSLEEDMKLTAYLTRYGCWNWSQLPKYAGLTRCGKSCRLRWLNYLRPNLKRGNFTQQEEDIIVRLHNKLGNRWSSIATELPGRTDNEIKNYWHSTLKKRLQQKDVISNNNNKESSKSSSSQEWNRERDMVVVLKNNNVAVDHDPSECSTTPSSPLSSSSSDEFCSVTTSDHNNTTATDKENLVLLEDDDLSFLEKLWTEPYTMVGEEIYHHQIIINEKFSNNNCNNNHDHFQQSPDSKVKIIPDASSDTTNFDYHIEAMIQNFWSQPYIKDMSHIQ